ncbi:hypothetical protein M413DRAFT_22581 [Hebeloma cylindrosporum]|uniref:Ino eighty subunit 1 n=1 Tax=Hebeloma cylindrosporum TaxID=76867 RepID=A0A0C3CV61_HEBCY|nr:hypothetical protein M413DRAFT_22581 [Hebeloma cylindrosporum h7]
MAFIPSASSSHNMTPSWAVEAIPPVGYLSRKALPIKRNDAEPLTREDVQYDLLHYIFSDNHAVFTNPDSGKGEKVTFGDLYVSALYTSSKCSKVLKEKMVETPAFSIEFAKIALLTNVGRINTTMAFFPEMKTALRTYHPVPSLQKTDGNAQDAPRIKNCLKAALLPSELKAAPPSTPDEVLAKLREGQHPPTSVVNLIFVLANHAAPLSTVHFDGSLNFLDLFLPNTHISSASRGRAFLWLLFHYLETEHPPNPFDDQYSLRHPGRIPYLRPLTATEYSRENVDTAQEILWGNTMSGLRNLFLQKLVSTADHEKRSKTNTPHFVTALPESGSNPSRNQRLLQDSRRDERFLFYVPGQETQPPQPSESRRKCPPGHRPSASEGHQRTMFQQAWQSVISEDPLADSDDELLDRHAHIDYVRRLNVVSRIHRRPPTPT